MMIQEINSIETYAYGTSKDLVSEKEDIKCSNIIKAIQKMTNFDNIIKGNIKDYNSNWPEISVHPYRDLIIGGSESVKINSLVNLINQQPDIDKIYLYAKDPYEAEYQVLIVKRKSTGLKQFKNFKAFIEY